MELGCKSNILPSKNGKKNRPEEKTEYLREKDEKLRKPGVTNEAAKNNHSTIKEEKNNVNNSEKNNERSKK